MITLYSGENVNIQKDTINKALVIRLFGFADKNKAGSFLDIYKDAISKVTPSSYSLIIDSSGLKTFHKDILPILSKCYALYMSSGFKHVFMVNPQDPLSKMQLKRIGKESGFTGQFVNSFDEAVSLGK